MLPDYEIVLGRGIGTLLFGMTKEEIVEIIGTPDEIDKPSDIEGYNWEKYEYNFLKCSFSFDPEDEDRLVEMSIENETFHLLHKIRIGVKKGDLLKFGEELKFGTYIIEDMRSEEDPTHELISYNKAGVNLWLDDGRISSIQILPLFNNEGLPIWPENLDTN
jgi:hypothetical protein